MILEVPVETLSQPSMENTTYLRTPIQLLRGSLCHIEAYLFSFLQVSHVFSNLKKGVRFVSFECCIWDLEFRNEQYGISVTNSSVIVQVCVS